MPKKKNTTSPPKGLLPYWDAQRRTCLFVRRVAGQVFYIPLVAGTVLRMAKVREQAFDLGWRPIPNQPADKTAQLFLRYTQDLGAEKDVMEALTTMVQVLPGHREHAAAIITKVQPPAPTATKRGAF